MKNKKQKQYKSSYRKQLIRLAKFYGVVEIKNYFKSKKKLTNSQIELILVKNKIKLPAYGNLPKLNHLSITKNKYINKFISLGVVTLLAIGFFGGAPHLIKSFHKINSYLWTNENEIVKYSGETIDKILKKSREKSKNITEEDSENYLENTIIRESEDTTDNKVSLKASVVASLFQDHDYDLSKIREGKKVKPFYISLLPKDLSSIEDVKERKELFIKIVLPLILQENNNIKKDRKKLFKILAKNINSQNDKNWLKWKFSEYKIKNSDISELKLRMDIVPVSLAIAQAAIETGWGTSRFALEGNALYGQWTYSKDGLKPLGIKSGDESLGHKVMRFKILTASVKSYKRNLNTHSGYSKFREERAALRSRNEKPSGLKLTKYLDKYAATGEDYTKKLELTIKKNSLSDFENAKLLSTGLRKGINL